MDGVGGDADESVVGCLFDGVDDAWAVLTIESEDSVFWVIHDELGEVGRRFDCEPFVDGVGCEVDFFAVELPVFVDGMPLC